MKPHAIVRTTLTLGAALAAVGLATACTANSDTKAVAAPAAAEVAAPTEQEIEALFDEWNAALATGDPEQVADRYASDAVLLPTASPKVRTNRAEIVDYFEHFLKNKPQGERTEPVINILDDNSALDTGIYEFTLTNDEGTRVVEARYTFEYEKRDGEWLIVNHHSSWLPDEG